MTTRERDRDLEAARRAMLRALGVELSDEGDPTVAWRHAATAWEQRAGVQEARADALEQERDELRARVERLDQALDRMAGPAR